MSGSILLENMEFRASHGCYELEKIVGNKFLVDLEIHADMERACLSDEVSDSVNYLTAYEIVRSVMAVPSNILENVAARIIDALKESFPQIEKIRVKVSKIAPPLGGKVEKVSVILTR